DQEEQRALDNIENRFTTIWTRHLTGPLEEDLEVAQQIQYDLLDLMTRASEGKAVNKSLVKTVRSALSAATSVLIASNDILDELYKARLIVVLCAGWDNELMKKAKELEKQLAALQKKLEKARTVYSDAQLQLYLNLAITAFTTFSGPLGWLTRGTIG